MHPPAPLPLDRERETKDPITCRRRCSLSLSLARARARWPGMQLCYICPSTCINRRELTTSFALSTIRLVMYIYLYISFYFSRHFSSSLLDYSITGFLFSVLYCAVSEAKEEKDHEGYERARALPTRIAVVGKIGVRVRQMMMYGCEL